MCPCTCLDLEKSAFPIATLTWRQSQADLAPLFPQVAGERYVYKFVCEPEALFSLAFPDNQRPALKAEFDRPVSEEDTVPLSHLDESPAYLPELAGPAQPFGPKGGYSY